MSVEVQLIAGPARCGKTQFLQRKYLDQLFASSEHGHSQFARCCWLAPNRSAVMQLQNRLVEKASRTILAPNLHTFAGFAETLIATSKQRVRSISAIQKRRLIRQVIQGLIENGNIDHFSQVATTPGFVSQAETLIAELKRADIWPEKFQQWCQHRPRLDRRNREFSLIYDGYQQLLHQGELYDAEGRFWVAREILTATNAEGIQQYDLVVINGFNDFTTAQYDILRLLGECSRRLLISLTVEQASDTTDESDLLFAKTNQTLQRLQQTFPTLTVKALTPQQAASGSLEQLQQNLFRELPAPAETDSTIGGVEILEANSELGEIEAIAERIKSLLQNQRTQPQDIVVVGRGGESQMTLFSSVFTDFGIPYAAELQPRLVVDPLVRALLSLVRLHQQDWPYHTLLEVIGNQLFTRFETNFDDADSYSLQPRVATEQTIRTIQLPAGRVALLEQLEYRRGLIEPDIESPTNLRAAQMSVALNELRQLDKLLAALPTKATIHQWVAAIESTLSQLGALEVDANSNARAASTWRLLQRGLLSLASVDSWSKTQQQMLSLAEIEELIVEVAGEQRLPAAGEPLGRVRILSAESARKLSIKHLFLAGLGEQAFVSGPTTEHAVAINSLERQSAKLPDSHVELEPAQLRRGEAMLLFYELATRATHSLTLSYAALDQKGQPLPPSPLLVEMQRSAGPGRIPCTTMSLGQNDSTKSLPKSVGSFRRQAVQQAQDNDHRWLAGMISSPNLVRTGSTILSGIEAVAQRSTRDTFSPYEGMLLGESSSSTLARRFDSSHLWSPSQLEGYAACPFRFFAEQLLGLEPIHELQLSNDARRRGSLLHQVLATIHQQLRLEPLSGSANEQESQELVERFLAALDAAVNAVPLRGIEHSLREIERREIEAWAPGYAEQEKDYRQLWNHLDEPPLPSYFEVRFGPETRHSDEQADRASTPLPFELDLGDERIRLTGQIDRVDIGRVGKITVFNIIDYKSGQEVKLDLDKVRSGRQLQLPLYALAAEQLLFADEGAVALATGYWNIRGKGFGTRGSAALQLREIAEHSLKTSADWKKLQPDILHQMQQLIRGIRSGHFPVYNDDKDCTRSCSLSTICRIGQVRNLEKVWPLESESEGGPDGG